MTFKRSLLGAALIAGTAIGLLHGAPSLATTPTATKDVFPSKAAAEKRATELKCTGAHGSGMAWMPCADKAAYEKATKMAKP